MADTLKHDAEMFEKAAQRTGHVRDRINSVLSALESSIAGRGAPWGNDKLGSQFADGANGYLVARGKLTGNGENMAQSFDNFSTGQTKSARLIRTMDATNGHGFQGPR